MTDTLGHRCTCEKSHEFWRPYPIPRACPVEVIWGGPCGARITFSTHRKFSKMPKHIQAEWLKARNR